MKCYGWVEVQAWREETVKNMMEKSGDKHDLFGKYYPGIDLKNELEEFFKEIGLDLEKELKKHEGNIRDRDSR